MKVTSISGISKIIHHNICHLFLFGKRKIQSFKILLKVLKVLKVSIIFPTLK